MTLNRLIGYLTLLIPFFAMAYMIADNEHKLSSTTEYRIAIKGYDPVNILTGHYIRFAYDWPKEAPNSCGKSRPCYVCFNGAPTNPSVSFVLAGGLSSCAAALEIAGEYNPAWSQPVGRLTQYHIAETDADALNMLLIDKAGKFQVGLTVFKDHTAAIKGLYLNDERIEKFSK